MGMTIERTRELTGYLISLASITDEVLTTRFANELDKLLLKIEEAVNLREKHSKPVKYLDVLFVENKDKPPFTMEFVEVENEFGESVSFGEWIKDGEYSRLRIPLSKSEEVTK